MRESINDFLDSYGDDDILPDRLTDEEWEILIKIYTMLASLKQTTKSLEGSGISLTKALPAMDFILTRFEDGRKEYKNDAIMAPLFQNGWEKLRKYYKLTDETPAYVAAIVLNPGYKWDYVNDHWEND
jgi:hypothetical protein